MEAKEAKWSKAYIGTSNVWTLELLIILLNFTYLPLINQLINDFP